MRSNSCTVFAYVLISLSQEQRNNNIINDIRQVQVHNKNISWRKNQPENYCKVN